MRKGLLAMAAAILFTTCIIGCKGKEGKVMPVSGVIEQNTETGTPPQAVREALQAPVIDDRFECFFRDSLHGVSAWSLLRCADTVSAEGYGVVIMKGEVKTVLPDIRHGNMPQARYDADKGILYLVGTDMEGTGVLVERLYLLHFDDKGTAVIDTSIDPYDIQQAFCNRLGFTVSGEQVTLYDEGKPLAIVMNHVEDMGGFMDHAVWIGEQVSYQLDSVPTVCIVPGINFVVGKVLHYDDMPTIAASLVLDGSGFTLSDIRKAEDE